VVAGSVLALHRVYLAPDAVAAATRVLQSGQLAAGPEVDAFEREFGAFIGNRRVASCGDIGTGMMIALGLADVGPGDEVITSPVSCLNTTIPIAARFAKVVWADVDPATAQLDPDDVACRITSRTKAILAFHWVGYPAPLADLRRVAREHGLRLIEDAGEALGATFEGAPIGTGSDLVVFSFAAIRHLTASEGAAVAVATDADLERARRLRRYGIHQPTFRDDRGELSPASVIPEPGYGASMSDIEAAIGRAQLPHVAGLIARHRANARWYDEALAGIAGVTPLRPVPGANPSYWVYTLRAERRDALLAHLAAQGVRASQVHIRNDVYAVFGGMARRLPGVDDFSARSLSIPCGWWVTDEDRDHVARAIRVGAPETA